MAKQVEIKVVNNMPIGALGIVLSNGKTHVLRKPGAFKMVTSEDIWQIFNSSKTIQKGYLYIDNKSMRVELGLEEDDYIDVNALSRDELKDLVETYSVKELQDVFKSDLSDGTKEKLVMLAREQYKESSLDARKLKLIEKETGLMIADDDGSNIEEIDDVKETKKVTKKPKKTTK